MKYAYLLITTCLMMACTGSNKKNTAFDTTSSTNSQSLFEASGIPSSPEYNDATQYLNIKELESEKSTKIKTTPKKVSETPIIIEKPVLIASNEDFGPTPWNINTPLDSKIMRRLKADHEQAFEYMGIANEGKNVTIHLKSAAKLFIKASRLPDKDFYAGFRANCLYNTACCYSLLHKNSEAVKFLTLAVKKFGFADSKKNKDHMKTDSDLNNIRNEPGYLELLGEKKIDEKIILKKDKYVALYKEADRLYDEKKFEEAAEKYIKSAESVPYTQKGYYNAACCYSLANNTKLAIKWLKKALESGWNKPEMLKTDSDLKNLRGLDQFKKLIEK